MKKIFTIFLFLNVFISDAQNLIANGGFEIYDTLPNDLAQFKRAKGWTNCGGSGSPDYFHLDGNGLAKLPDCSFSHVLPHSGNAVMGLSTWSENEYMLNYREYISCALEESLMIGQIYKVSFFITNGITPYIHGKTGSNNMSVAFSTLPVIQNHDYPIIKIKPQFIKGSVFFDSTWREISFTFKALKPYNYITFGNFFTDERTIGHVYVPGAYNFAYYFIDDISVSVTDSMFNNTDNNISLAVYPNPFKDFLYIDLNNNEKSEFILYDDIARKVISEFFVGSIKIRTSELSQGIYFYEIKNRFGLITKGKILHKY